MDKDMFSDLTQILKPAVRQAEETDTHLYIRKHDRDQGKKKRGSRQDKDDYFDMEDRATVSVEALYAFISNMLLDAGPAPSSPSSPPPQHQTPGNDPDVRNADKPLDHQPESAPEATPNPPGFNVQTARAASAYAHAAETMPQRPAADRDNMTRGQSQSAGDNGPESHINEHSSRHDLLRQLLQEIEVLRARNIREITIEKADSFEDSLFDAILAAKQ
tara:strand:+ start:3336 stop:3989 length:654 start_codon:yes stop_codon:yes gene_type:complete